MWVSKLELSNFRNYRDLDLELEPQPMIFQGDNAQGKSNLLEAIWVLTTTKSHRALNERELVNWAIHSEPLAVTRLYGQVKRSKDSLELEISLKLDKSDHPDVPEGERITRKRIRVNGIVRRAADSVGQANAVMFSAHDLGIISGAPNLRRRHLDLVCSQVNPHYLRCLQRYQRVLVQRNRLLVLIQQHQAQPAELEFWDNELVQSGSYLIAQRHSLVLSVNALSAAIHDKLSGGIEKLQLAYLPNVGRSSTAQQDIEAEFRGAVHGAQRAEISRGMTLTGPHRDNLQFLVNNVDMGAYGSRGQQRTVALSLRLAEASHLHDEAHDAPILLLDDILSELDHARRRYLLETITPSQQVLITTTDLDPFDTSFLSLATRFTVREGNIRQA